jgi:hypothetical protein
VDGGLNAEFTTGTPWLSVGVASPVCNVQTETVEPLSHVESTRAVSGLRRQLPALHSGSYVARGGDRSSVLAYERRLDGAATVLVMLNMSATTQKALLAVNHLKIEWSLGATELGAGVDFSYLGKDAAVRGGDRGGEAVSGC